MLAHDASRLPRAPHASAAVYILLFTQMGFGESFYYALSHSQFADYSWVLAGGLVLAGLFFYLLDISEWNGIVGRVVRGLFGAAAFAVFVLLVLLVSNEFPAGVLALFALINPLWLLACRTLFYRAREARTFASWLSGPLLLVAALTAASFVAWVAADFSNGLNSVTRVEAAERTGCPPDTESYPACAAGDGVNGVCFYVDYAEEHEGLVFPDGCDHACLKVYSACANGFILWSGPVDICLSMLFLSYVCTFLRKGKLIAKFPCLCLSRIRVRLMRTSSPSMRHFA